MQNGTLFLSHCSKWFLIMLTIYLGNKSKIQYSIRNNGVSLIGKSIFRLSFIHKKSIVSMHKQG